MKKFVILYHSPVDAMEQTAKLSPEEQAKGMEGWMQWAQKLGNKLVDLGTPLANGLQLNPDGKSKNSSKNVSGYSILQAENMDEAKALLKGHPHLSWSADSTIEVHEALPLPGM